MAAIRPPPGRAGRRLPPGLCTIAAGPAAARRDRPAAV